MAQSEKERRDKNFRKLCRWMHEAGEITEILKEESSVVKQADRQGGEKEDLNTRGATEMEDKPIRLTVRFASDDDLTAEEAARMESARRAVKTAVKKIIGEILTTKKETQK